MAVNVGRSTKIALVQHKKTVVWLAKQLGVSNTRASAICNRAEGTAASIDRLANLFGMTSAEFIALGEREPGQLNERKDA